MNWFEAYALFGSPLVLLAVGVGGGLYLVRREDRRTKIHPGE